MELACFQINRQADIAILAQKHTEKASTFQSDMGDNSTPSWPPLLLRHLGTWKGKLVRLDSSTGEIVERHTTKIEPGVRGNKYSQRNTYTWDDGRTEVWEFAGRMQPDGSLKVWSGRLGGLMKVVDKDSCVFYAKYEMEGRGAGLTTDVWEFIRLLTDTHRVRTWQIVKKGKACEVAHILEDKVSDDDTYFEIEE